VSRKLSADSGQTLVQRALAYGLGRWVAGLLEVALLAVTVTSALPTAQNVFVYASSYDRGTLLARDVVLAPPSCPFPCSSGSPSCSADRDIVGISTHTRADLDKHRRGLLAWGV